MFGVQTVGHTGGQQGTSTAIIVVPEWSMRALMFWRKALQASQA
jgi:hypothetical protein